MMKEYSADSTERERLCAISIKDRIFIVEIDKRLIREGSKLYINEGVFV